MWKVARGSLLVLLVAVLGVLFPGTALGVDAGPSGPPAPVTLILFHGEGCPHCAAEREFLTELSAAYPDLVIEQYEVWNDAANRDLLMQTAARLGFDPSGVPVTVIGDEVWIGYADSIGEEITAAVEAGLRASSTAPSPSGAAAVEPPPVNASETVVDVPVLGAVDVSSSSLLVTTLVIGFVDGVNPCSLWVLSLLLAMVLNRGSRGRVLIVGSTFLAVTAAMYALYIFGFYSALDYVGGLSWIRYFVAAIAMTFGVLQLKDGIRPGVGPSLSIAPSARPRIYERMRMVAAPDRRLAATLVGTVGLAIGVSLLETPCTAGLPLLWTSILTERDVGLGAAVALFAVYMTVFLLDELVVFGIAVVTLRATKLQERHGRLLKILAGSFLVTLALTMIVAPNAMDTLAGAAWVFAVAGGIALTLLLAMRLQRIEAR